jgi:hypothetical protein
MPITTGLSTIAKGDLVTEVHTTHGLVSSVIRIRDGIDGIEVEHTVDSIPIDDGVGKEPIVRYTTSIQSDGVFYSDSNGREMQRRQRDHRDMWNLDMSSNNISRNYFPVNAVATMKDSLAQVSVILDRSEGMSSLVDGQLEFMLHRRLVCDDNKGAGESLNEVGPDGKGLKMRGSHILMISTPQGASQDAKTLQALVFAEPLLVFSKASKVKPVSSSDDVSFVSKKSEVTKFSFLGKDLPSSLSLVTLQDLGSNQLLIRIGHLYEANEDKNLSHPVAVDLQTIFPNFKIKNITEMQLSGVKPKKDVKRLDWGIASSQGNSYENQMMIKNKHVLSINPMEIKTVVVEI